jgi:hypothetical protein
MEYKLAVALIRVVAQWQIPTNNVVNHKIYGLSHSEKSPNHNLKVRHPRCGVKIKKCAVYVYVKHKYVLLVC